MSNKQTYLSNDTEGVLMALEYWSRPVDIRAKTANLIYSASPNRDGNFTSMKHATIFNDREMHEYAKKNDINLDWMRE